MIAYFDASALIYLIEGEQRLAGRIGAEIEKLDRAHRNLRVAASRLSWLECRIAPMRAGEHGVLARYDEFFSQGGFAWVELTQQIIELATVIRARHGLRTPDALQAASCMNYSMEHAFLTGDKAFSRVEGLNAIVLTV